MALGATPSVPVLTYTADKQFTISGFDSSLSYSVANGSRSGSIVTVATTGTTATITAKYPRSVSSSAARSLLTLAHGIVLTSPGAFIGSEGCGPRPNICCPAGQIQSTNGNQCGGAPGTQGNFAGCPNCTDPPCFGLFIQCYYWNYTNYSANGYALLGNVWGKTQ